RSDNKFQAVKKQAAKQKKLYQQEQKNHSLTKQQLINANLAQQQAEAERDNYRKQLAEKDQIIQEQTRKIRELENKPPIIETKTQTIEKIKEVEKEKIVEKPIISGESLAEIIAINLTALEKELNIELTSELKEQISQELGISKSIELTPHTLRRAFATYQAESERHDPSQSKEPPKPPSMEIFPLLKVETFSETPKVSKPIFVENKPVISNKNLIQQDNSLSPISAKPKSAKIDFQCKPVISEIQTKPSGKIFLNSKTNQQSEISQPLALITRQKAPPTEKETILLIKIKQLEEQLKQTQTECDNLTAKLAQTGAIAIQEKKRADNYQRQLKTTSQLLHQWQKNNYYQQLEQGTESKIIHYPQFKEWFTTALKASNDTILEPFAGSNNLIKMLQDENYNFDFVAYDINPGSPE
ncbi:6125_t:CDS:2, partial [Cetraspora pellucida]